MYIAITMKPTMPPTRMIMTGSRIDVSALTAAVDLVLVEVGDLGEHRVEVARLLADGDHLGDHRREDRGFLERVRDRAAGLDGLDDVGHRLLDDRVARRLAGDLDRLHDRHAGGVERGERARPARERDLLDRLRRS